jgi:putative DNA-invertase from lambdoid prophage Rac
MTIFGYSRVSTTDQAEGTSLEDQRARIEWVVDGMKRARSAPRPEVQHYQDAGVSGSTHMTERPQGGYMVELLSRGDILIVAKLDRAFRSAEDALRTARELQERGVDLIVADISTDPVTNGVGKMFFTMLAALAEFERERILERTRDGRRGKKARGGFIGGTVPFGYRVEGEGSQAHLVEVPEEQAALASILELREAGLSLRDVATQVNERHGTSISYQVVRRVERDHHAQQEQMEVEDE